MRRAKYHRIRMAYAFVIILFLFLCPYVVPGEIFINEILATTEEADEFGTSLEWIELFNSGDVAVNLLGYTLSDDPLAPGKWMFGAEEIPAKGFFLVWATGYDLLDRGNYHTNFRLDRDGEMLGLYGPDGSEIDVIHYPLQRRNYSYGRQPNGEELWQYFEQPSPRISNRSAGATGFAQAPEFSAEGGLYQQALSLALSTADTDVDIRYTLDGSEPTESSAKYTVPFTIRETGMVRARAMGEDFFPSPIVTHTYIFRDMLVLPVLSLVAEPDDLFGNSIGIYANPGQHGDAWERPVSVEFFTKDGVREFQENSGIRIHGGASRSRSPKKSFRLYFRSEYGATRLKYPLFPDAGVEKINQIVVRGGFNDTWGYDNTSQRPTAIYVSDQVARDLHRDMGQLACDGIFVELYVNGENWGIYNPSERIEEDFFEQHTGIEGWTVVADGGEVKDGDESLWSDYLREIQRNSYTGAEGIGELEALVDMESFTAFLILNTWIQNYDWPRHNWLCSRPNDDGQWLFLAWDVEYSFGSGSQGYQTNVDVYGNIFGDQPLGALFTKLIRNPDYQAYYWKLVNQYLDTALKEENVLARLNARLDEIRDAIPFEAEKWGGRKGGDPAKTPEDWEKAAQQARDFVTARTPIFLQQTERAVGPKPVFVSDWQIF